MYTALKLLVWLPLLVSCTVLYDKDRHEVTISARFDGVQESTVHLKSNQSSWFAKTYYNNTFSSKGWDFLRIETNPFNTDEEQAYYAGFIEGYMTHSAIYNYSYNVLRTFCDDQRQFCEKVEEYLVRNFAWMEKSIPPNKAVNNPFWHQVHLFTRQLRGIYDAYNYFNWGSKEEMTFRQFVWLNFLSEIETLKSVFNTTAIPSSVEGSTHCSGLIKLLPGFQDLLVSHVTWTGYHYMVRMIKRYDFHFHTAANNKVRIPGKSMSFSGYPGVITSVDDFYVIKSGLVVLETTIGNSNNSLWKHVQPTGQILESIRSMVANRLARNGREWTNIFSEYNNGLYNNQWMIVDMKRFAPGQEPRKDLLWVSEQTPGLVQSADKTDTLLQQQYWPSYNIPSFPEVFKRMGNEKLVQQYGDWFSYENAPRAKIFRRDQNKVKNVDSMMRLMRSNDYKNDPYAKCNCSPPYSAANAISCRDDLNPKNGSYPFPALGHRNHGAIDAKVTNYHLTYRLQFHAISGPTRGNNLPPFKWSESDFNNVSHIGMPDEFNFPNVLHRWQ